jgi:hypothetical protein
MICERYYFTLLHQKLASYKGIKLLGEGRKNPPPPYVSMSNQIFEVIGSGVSTLEPFYFINYDKI